LCVVVSLQLLVREPDLVQEHEPAGIVLRPHEREVEPRLCEAGLVVAQCTFVPREGTIDFAGIGMNLGDLISRGVRKALPGGSSGASRFALVWRPDRVARAACLAGAVAANVR